MGALVFVVIGALLVAYIIFEFNKFVELRNKVRQSKSSIEVYLNKRFDLIPNLVSCVKGYMQHEADTLSKMSIARIRFEKDANLKEGVKLAKEFNRIMAVGEDYPELKASEQFLRLQKALCEVESQLQAARRVYNGDVTLYNTTISTIPSNIVASLFGFKEEELFEMEEYKKENIEIEL